MIDVSMIDMPDVSMIDMPDVSMIDMPVEALVGIMQTRNRRICAESIFEVSNYHATRKRPPCIPLDAVGRNRSRNKASRGMHKPVSSHRGRR